MTSFFPFSSSSTSLSSPNSTLINDDPHLEVTVTPSSSAFYAGETFSVTITFRNTRTPPAPLHHVPITPSTVPATADVMSAVRAMPPVAEQSVSHGPMPERRHQIGNGLLSFKSGEGNAEAGPSRTPGTTDTPSLERVGYPYSPGANPAYRAPRWPGSGDGMTIRSPEARGQRDYGEIGKGPGQGHGRRTRSLALGKGVMSPQEMVWALGGQQNPPPLPTRRPQTSTIPSNHPHSRKISITTSITSPPATTSSLPTPDLQSISETLHPGPAAGSSELSRPNSRPTPSTSATSSASASRSNIDLADDSSSSSDITASRPRRAPPPSSLAHNRTPSYHNAYGLLSAGAPAPPPVHPYIRSQEPHGITTILWAYTRLVAHFHPSNTYIPPDPLLPLRSMLLHRPVGSGSLMDPSSNDADAGGPLASSGSRWQLSFGTGMIGKDTQPSLTGSLFGLAKDLVYGGQGGSLEEERKRVWNMKDLPVLETSRSLLGVDVKLKEGESREFVYTIQLPTTLPPTFRGRAFRFSYDLVVSLNVALPGTGKKHKTKEVTVPIRVWANVSLSNPLRTYDVLKPVIQTVDQGTVTENVPASGAGVQGKRRSSVSERKQHGGDSMESLQAYAKHLIDAVSSSTPPLNGKPRLAPLSPSKVPTPTRVLPPSSPSLDVQGASSNGKTLGIPGNPSFRPRQGSFVKGDDELVADGHEEEFSREAVEILSRHSPKSSYDIAKDGKMVAVLTLIKTTYRLGESVLGVVMFHGPERRVLKFSAYLESNEIIPEMLLPLSPSSAGRERQPPLYRLHAESHSAYTLHTSRTAFSLDIPSDAAPAFSVNAGEEGFKGGLQWTVKLSFLVSRRGGSHLLPVSGVTGDADNNLYAASTSLTGRREGEKDDCEVVECDIPIRVLAGNTAFVVKPSVYVV